MYLQETLVLAYSEIAVACSSALYVATVAVIVETETSLYFCRILFLSLS